MKIKKDLDKKVLNNIEVDEYIKKIIERALNFQSDIY